MSAAQLFETPSLSMSVRFERRSVRMGAEWSRSARGYAPTYGTVGCLFLTVGDTVAMSFQDADVDAVAIAAGQLADRLGVTLEVTR